MLHVTRQLWAHGQTCGRGPGQWTVAARGFKSFNSVKSLNSVICFGIYDNILIGGCLLHLPLHLLFSQLRNKYYIIHF